MSGWKGFLGYHWLSFIRVLKKSSRSSYSLSDIYYILQRCRNTVVMHLICWETWPVLSRIPKTLVSFATDRLFVSLNYVALKYSLLTTRLRASRNISPLWPSNIYRCRSLRSDTLTIFPFAETNFHSWRLNFNPLFFRKTKYSIKLLKNCQRDKKIAEKLQAATYKTLMNEQRCLGGLFVEIREYIYIYIRFEERTTTWIQSAALVPRDHNDARAAAFCVSPRYICVFSV